MPETGAAARHASVVPGEVGGVVERTYRHLARRTVSRARGEQGVDRSPACGVAAEPRGRAAAFPARPLLFVDCPRAVERPLAQIRADPSEEARGVRAPSGID